MKKYLLKVVKNKYALTGTIFLLYTFLLDESDIFTILSTKRKLQEIKLEKVEITQKLNETQYIIRRLKYTGEIERFAREKKYFKKDNEDVFVLYYQ